MDSVDESKSATKMMGNKDNDDDCSDSSVGSVKCSKKTGSAFGDTKND